MKRELPDNVYAPTSLDIDITIPRLYKIVWLWKRVGWIFRRNIAQAYEHGADIRVSITVEWPNGKKTMHETKMMGKCSQSFTKRLQIEASGETR